MKSLTQESLQRHPPMPGQQWRAWAWGLLLVILVLVVYQPTLQNGFIWDDDSYVENNGTLRTGQGLFDMWFKPRSIPQYYPLVHTTFWLEYQFSELQPRLYHIDNMLLQAVAAVLLWRLLVRLAVPGAWLAAAIFAVHPVNVESVAWVTERKNVLSIGLALGSILAYLRFVPPEEVPLASQGTTIPRHWIAYALAFALYIGALLSKTVTASVPAVLLVIYWWKRGRITLRDFAPLVPMFVVGGLLASYTVWLEKHHVGARGAEWEIAPLERVLLAGRIAWFYAGKLVWPHPIVFFYPRWEIDQRVAWQFLFPLAALAVIVGLWLARGRLGRGPLAAVLIFVGVLFPALGFFNVYPFRYSFVADHFQYHACAALIALFAAGVTMAWQRFGASTLLGIVAGACLLAPLGWIARDKTHAYKDLETLYADTIALNPTAWAAYVNLGCYLEGQGKSAEAIHYFREAVRIDPRKRPRLNLGGALSASGYHQEAIEQLTALLGQEQTEFERGLAHLNMAMVLIRLDKNQEALEQIRLALEKWPENSDAFYNWGVALARLGDVDGAIDKLRESVRLAPGFPMAHHDLGMLLLGKGRKAEAIASLDQAVSLKPSDFKLQEDLGEAFWKIGDLNKAEKSLRTAVLLNSRSANAHNLLGAVIGQKGDLNGAIAQFQSALAIEPDNFQARANLKTAQDALQPPPRSGKSGGGRG